MVNNLACQLKGTVQGEEAEEMSETRGLIDPKDMETGMKDCRVSIHGGGEEN